MTTFLLPYVSPRTIGVKLDVSDDRTSPTMISFSLEEYLCKQKSQIDACQKEWDNYKKYTNPYEWIHTSYNGSFPVCSLRPLSRSFYKLIEIMDTFELGRSFPSTGMRSFHIAEGPGGFIEALTHVRGDQSDDSYVGMTLLVWAGEVPGWKKSVSFLEKHPNVQIESGEDGTGNILTEANLLKCAREYACSMDFVTADGGFDFSSDFNGQENQMSSLLVAQVAMATAVQKQGGTFVLKMFDMFSKVSVQILYLLSVYYEKVSIVKPNTSRYANSERYVVAQGFRPRDGRKEVTIMFLDKYAKLADNNVISLFDEEVPRFFLSRLEECNAIIGQQQMDTIVSTINLIRNPRQDKIEKMRVSNIQRCVYWCQKHKMPFTRDVRQVNMFLSAKNKVSRVPRKSEECSEVEQVESSGYEAWKSAESGLRKGRGVGQSSNSCTDIDIDTSMYVIASSTSASEASSDCSSHGDRRQSDIESEERDHQLPEHSDEVDNEDVTTLVAEKDENVSGS